MDFYSEHLLQLKGSLIVCLDYLLQHWPHGLQILLSQLKGLLSLVECLVWSPHLTNGHDMPTFPFLGGQDRSTFYFLMSHIVWYLVRLHCLYRYLGGSLATFFHYLNQRCLALYLQKEITPRWQGLQDLLRASGTRWISSFFQPILAIGGIKRLVDTPTMDIESNGSVR